jgi:hypothetical protein
MLTSRVDMFLGCATRGQQALRPQQGLLSLVFSRDMRNSLRRFVLIRVALCLAHKYPEVLS